MKFKVAGLSHWAWPGFPLSSISFVALVTCTCNVIPSHSPTSGAILTGLLSLQSGCWLSRVTVPPDARPAQASGGIPRALRSPGFGNFSPRHPNQLGNYVGTAPHHNHNRQPLSVRLEISLLKVLKRENENVHGNAHVLQTQSRCVCARSANAETNHRYGWSPILAPSPRQLRVILVM